MRSLKGGLPHKTIAGIAAGVLAFAVSVVASQAASVRPVPKNTETLSATLQSFFTPKQFDTDGSVYGVRVRDDSSGLPDLQIMPEAKMRIAAPTSAACPEVASGVCFAPHSLTTAHFGLDMRALGSGTLLISPASTAATPVVTPPITGALVTGALPTLSTSAVSRLADSLSIPNFDRASASIAGPRFLPMQNSAQIAPSYLVSGGVIPTSHANLLSGVEATGAINAVASYASGPLAAAISHSSVLQSAVVIDSYGHDYTVDLTKVADTRGFDPSYALVASRTIDFIPFAFGIDSPIGPLVASGYATDTIVPAAVSGMYRGASDHHEYDLRDFSLGVTIAKGVDVNLGYHLDMGGAFNNYDASGSAAYDGLFMSASAVNSPYASLANGGSFIGSTIALADDLHLRFGEISLSPEREPFTVNAYSAMDQFFGPRPLYDLRTAQGTMAGVSWDFARWGGVGLTATQIDEHNGLLGGYGSGALSVADSANTAALGVSARIGFGDGWVTTASYSEGITQLDLKPTGIFSQASDLRSRAYGIAVAKHGLFGEDSLGFAVTRPIQIYSGSAEVTAADGVDANYNLALNSERISLAGVKPETDIELGYVTTFLDGALALQANAAYQMNTQGQTGTNSLAVVSRAKIKF
ncbi:MAG TPA: hypothetical protein VG891_08815 [Rhizomicrobium sp.]|nr:hypothetical protein [Rhizomicrobium sp.]